MTFTACDKTRTCPAFDGELLNAWFPYQAGVTYRFVSSDGRQEYFTIVEENYTQEHEIESRALGKETFCEIHGERSTSIDTVTGDELPFRLFHTVESEKLHNTGIIEMTFRTMTGPMLMTNNGEEFSPTGSRIQYTVEHFDVWEVNGRNYTNIADFTFAEDDLEKVGIDRLYIAKGTGIIGYRTYPGGREYWQE